MIKGFLSCYLVSLVVQAFRFRHQITIINNY
jgi:hypothetical protein